MLRPDGVLYIVGEEMIGAAQAGLIGRKAELPLYQPLTQARRYPPVFI